MKQIYLIVALVIIFSTEKIVAQEQGVIDFAEVETFLTLSHFIRSGEIHFVVNVESKGYSAVKTKEYKITFFKTGELLDLDMTVYYYNLLDITNSLQYVYNGKIWYKIDHKKETYSIDTVDYKIDITPYIHPNGLMDELFWFYTRENWPGYFHYYDKQIKKMQKTRNRTVVTMEKTRFSPNCNIEKENEVQYIMEWEWDISKSLLYRFSRVLKDDKGYSKGTITKIEMFLINASLNDEKYKDSALYDGSNYVKSYSIENSVY